MFVGGFFVGLFLFFFKFIKGTQKRNNLDTILAEVWKSVPNSYASGVEIQRMKDCYSFSLLTISTSLFAIEILKYP